MRWCLPSHCLDWPGPLALQSEREKWWAPSPDLENLVLGQFPFSTFNGANCGGHPGVLDAKVLYRVQPRKAVWIPLLKLLQRQQLPPVDKDSTASVNAMPSTSCVLCVRMMPEASSAPYTQHISHWYWSSISANHAS